MLRRDRLRLVAAALGLVLVGCGPRALQNTDVEPLDGEELRRGRALLAAGETAQALAWWEALLTEHPDSWEGNRGLQDVLRASLPAADYEDIFRQRRDATPNDALAWYLWGRARIDREEEAREAFERASELAPMSPWPVAGLAYLPWRAGDLFLTVQTYEDAIERLPSSAMLRLLLGNQFISLRLVIEAQRHLEIARRLDGDDPAVLAALGKVYVELDQTDAGLALLEQALQMDPGLADVALALSQVYLQQRRVDEAEALYRRSLELGLPRDDELHGAIRAARVVERSRR